MHKKAQSVNLSSTPTVRTTADQNRGGGDDFFGFMTNQQIQIRCYETLS